MCSKVTEKTCLRGPACQSGKYLPKDVSAGMPEGVSSFIAIKLEQFQFTIAF